MAEGESKQHDGFDAFDENTWDEDFTPVSTTTWHRSSQARTLMIVSAAALSAIVVAAGLVAAWRHAGPALTRTAWTARTGAIAIALIAAVDMALFAQWAYFRTSKNYEASVEVGRLLPPGTLVQGKLANGLALENQIRPLFIGPGFGNYADRLNRPDVAWVLTYSRPRLGYEGVVVRDLLDATPGWTPIAEFPVAETRSGQDRAVLIRKPLR